MSYSKQTWTNNVSSIDEDKMNHIENGIYENSTEIGKLKNRNIISAGSNELITATGTGELQIPITQVFGQIGEDFSISNNKVYVGSGISKILISAQVYLNLSASRGSALNLVIKKNGTTIRGLINGGEHLKNLNGNQTLATAPCLVSVNEGDYFEYYAYVYSGDTIRSDQAITFLTIEAVG